MSTRPPVRNDPRLTALREQLAGWESAHHRRVERTAVISSGHLELDRYLPGGGLRGQELIEWFAVRAGCGAGTLALSVAAAVLRGQGDRSAGVFVVIDPQRTFYPPAAAHLGYRFAASGDRPSPPRGGMCVGLGSGVAIDGRAMPCGAGCRGSTHAIFVAFS